MTQTTPAEKRVKALKPILMWPIPTDEEYIKWMEWVEEQAND